MSSKGNITGLTSLYQNIMLCHPPVTHTPSPPTAIKDKGHTHLLWDEGTLDSRRKSYPFPSTCLRVGSPLHGFPEGCSRRPCFRHRTVVVLCQTVGGCRGDATWCLLWGTTRVDPRKEKNLTETSVFLFKFTKYSFFTWFSP